MKWYNMLMNNDPYFTPQDTPPQIPQKPIKTYHPKRVGTILSIIAVLIIVIAGVVVYLAIQPKKQVETPAEVVKDNSLREKLTAKEVISRVNKKMQWSEEAKTAPSIPIKVDGYNFYTIVADATQMKSITAVRTATQANDNAKTIEDILTKDQFSKMAVQDEPDNGSFVANFVRTDVVCQFSNSPQDDKPGRVIEVRCLNKESYTSLAKTQAALYSVYSPAASVSYETGFIGSSVTHNSKLSGYTLAEIAISEISSQRITPLGIAMFYQSPDGLWHYFQTRQNDTLSCDLYKSPPVLRTIYEGEPCQDAKKGATVVEKPKAR